MFLNICIIGKEQDDTLSCSQSQLPQVTPRRTLTKILLVQHVEELKTTYISFLATAHSIPHHTLSSFII